MQTSEKKTVFITSRMVMEDILNDSSAAGTKLLQDKCVVISIYGNSYFGMDCGRPNILFTEEKKQEVIGKSGVKDVLNLCFGDYTPNDRDLDNEKLFSESQAKQVVEFVDKYKDEVEMFILHCDAGVSRSGAVGTFIQRYLELDEMELFKMNPYIAPNHFVLNILLEVSGMAEKRRREQFKLFMGETYAEKKGWV